MLAVANFTPTATALLIAAAAAGAAFGIVFAVRFAASFPALPSPGPETSELADEPPAVANLLVNRCQVTHAAAAATLLDLAARGHLEVFEAGVDRFVVRLRTTPRTARALLIALSGYGREGDVRRCYEAGFDLHLLKPPDPEEIHRALECRLEALAVSAVDCSP